MAESPSAQSKIGHYRIIREIGRGGQGEVYLAEDTQLFRKVALKVLTPALVLSPSVLVRFQREAEAASRLDHPGICSVYEAGEADGIHYIAMRYVEGDTLARQIDAARSSQATSRSMTAVVQLPRSDDEPATAEASEPPMPAGKPLLTSSNVPTSRAEILRVVRLIEKIALALHAAHEAGMIHRDIKPGNIMVTAGGDPVILDFGIARIEDPDTPSLTVSGDLLGTPAYMSPEQLLAQRIKLDRRTDVYSLGVSLYECLTLKRPYDAPSRDSLYQQIIAADLPDPRRLNPSISRDLKVVMATALEKDRNRRYKTALDFAEDLRRVRSYEPIHARPAGPLLRFRRWVQRNPVLATSTVALILLLATGLAISLALLSLIKKEQRAKEFAISEYTKALRQIESERQSKLNAPIEGQAASVHTEVRMVGESSQMRSLLDLGFLMASSFLESGNSKEALKFLKFLDEIVKIAGEQVDRIHLAILSGGAYITEFEANGQKDKAVLEKSFSYLNSAIDQLKDMTKSRPGRLSALARTYRARCFAFQGDLMKIDEDIEHAKGSYDQDPNLIINQADSYFIAGERMNDPDRTAAFLRAILRLELIKEDSLNARANYRKGYCYMRIGGKSDYYKKASTCFLIAERLGMKGNPELYDAWGESFIGLGDFIKAGQKYRESFNLKPNEKSCVKSAECFLKANNKVSAENILKRGLDEFPKSSALQSLLKSIRG